MRNLAGCQPDGDEGNRGEYAADVRALCPGG